MTSDVDGSSAELVSLRCYKQLLSDDSFATIVIMLLSAVGLSALAALFGKGDISGVVKIYNFDLLRGVSVSSITYATFLQSAFQGILA